MKNLINLSIIIILVLFWALPSFAQTMSNSNYTIKMGNLNMSAGTGTNSQYKLNETAGQTAPGLYSGTNYTVKAGFQYIKPSKITFSFAISQNLIDFGTITPTNPVTRTTDLTVSSNSSGFTVTASENQPLKSSNATIPDTSCDNGDCNPTKATQWGGVLTYGFGYRCDDLSGTNCASDFSSQSSSLGAAASFAYKPFPLSPATQTIISSSKGGIAQKSRITYKVNASSSQPVGTYTNVVTYVANSGF